MVMRPALMFVLILGLAAQVRAEDSVRRPVAPASAAVALTGNIRVDLFGMNELRSGPPPDSTTHSGAIPGEKSPWLAGGLSLVLPGAGQFYTKNYLKSAIFFAVEVAAWALAYTYDKKGDDQTTSFQSFADQNWSVVQYGQYTQQHLQGGGQFNWLISNDASLPPWERVNWQELNNMERAFSAQPGGGFYSHTLPARPAQQYYEEIGKYTQYNQGWNDADLTLPPDYSVLNAHLTPNFLYYGGQRAEANDYYTTAKTFVTVALINHVVSAVEAALSASSYNRDLHAEATVHTLPVPGGVTQAPALKVRLDF
jgi:hypothetical protein